MSKYPFCRLIGVVRLHEDDGIWFEPDAGRKWYLTLPVSYWARPRYIDERVVLEGYDTGDGWMKVERLLPLGWDVELPRRIGLRNPGLLC